MRRGPSQTSYTPVWCSEGQPQMKYCLFRTQPMSWLPTVAFIYLYFLSY
uniref:Uncharacterized protein n=1 Tax=Heterorhabditis bacteriophora TaxID=37862 RepID=A0A1I7X8X5_HETBA